MQFARLFDELPGKLFPFAMQPQVTAVDNPAGAGLDAPGAGTGDGMVNGKAAQIEAAATVTVQGTGDKRFLPRDLSQNLTASSLKAFSSASARQNCRCCFLSVVSSASCFQPAGFPGSLWSK